MAINDVDGLPQRCYSLLRTPNAWNMSYTATIAAFLLGASCQKWLCNSYNIKLEDLAHCCVEQDLLFVLH